MVGRTWSPPQSPAFPSEAGKGFAFDLGFFCVVLTLATIRLGGTAVVGNSTFVASCISQSYI